MRVMWSPPFLLIFLEKIIRKVFIQLKTRKKNPTSSCLLKTFKLCILKFFLLTFSELHNPHISIPGPCFEKIYKISEQPFETLLAFQFGENNLILQNTAYPDNSKEIL